MKAHSDEIYNKSMQGTCGVAISLRRTRCCRKRPALA